MYRYILLILFLLSARIPSFSQNKKTISTISKEICSCLEKSEDLRDDKAIEEALESCVMKVSLKNLDLIKKELGIDMTQGEEAGRQFGEIMAYELIKKCNTFLKFMMVLSTEDSYEEDSADGYKETEFYNPDLVPYEKYSTDSMSVTTMQCASIKNSKFIYLTENPTKNDYFILNGNECVEYHDGEKYQSKYEIKWKDDCKFVATFMESNNTEVNNLLSKGDKVTYQIIGIYNDIVYLNLDFKGFTKTFKMSIQK